MLAEVTGQGQQKHVPSRGGLSAAPMLDLQASHLTSESGSRETALYIASLMLWPRDAARQLVWQSVGGAIEARAALMEVSDEKLPVTAGEIVGFGERLATVHALIPEISHRLANVKRCGRTLRDFLDSNGYAGIGVRCHPAGAINSEPLTLSQARAKNTKRLVKRSGRAHRESEINRVKRWSEYRSVAHFGAALQSVRYSDIDPAIDLLPCAAGDLPRFLHRAELLRREALRAGLAKAETMWALPEEICNCLLDLGDFDSPILVDKNSDL